MSCMPPPEGAVLRQVETLAVHQTNCKTLSTGSHLSSIAQLRITKQRQTVEVQAMGHLHTHKNTLADVDRKRPRAETTVDGLVNVTICDFRLILRHDYFVFVFCKVSTLPLILLFTWSLRIVNQLPKSPLDLHPNRRSCCLWSLSAAYRVRTWWYMLHPVSPDAGRPCYPT